MAAPMHQPENPESAPFVAEVNPLDNYIPVSEAFSQGCFQIATFYGIKTARDELELETTNAHRSSITFSAPTFFRALDAPFVPGPSLTSDAYTFPENRLPTRVVQKSNCSLGDDLPYEPEPDLPSVNTELPPISTRRFNHRVAIRLKLSKACGIWNETQLVDWPYPSAYVRQQMPYRLSRGVRDDIHNADDNPLLHGYQEEVAVDLAAANDIGNWEWANGSIEEALDADNSMPTVVPDMRSALNNERLKRGIFGDGAWKKVTKIEEVSDEDETETETETSSQSETNRKSRFRTPSETESWAPSSSDESWDVGSTIERPIALPCATVNLPQIQLRQPHADPDNLIGLDAEFWKEQSTSCLLTDHARYAWPNLSARNMILGNFEGFEHDAESSEWLPFILTAEAQEHVQASHLSSLHEQLSEQLAHVHHLRNVALMTFDNGVAHPAIWHLADIEAMDYHMRLESEAQHVEERLEDIELEMSRSGDAGAVGVEDMVLHRLAISRDEVELHIDGVEAKWRSWPMIADHANSSTSDSIILPEMDHRLNFHRNAILSIFQSARAELQKYSWAWYQLGLPHRTFPFDGSSSIPWPVLPAGLTLSFPLPSSLSTTQTAQYQAHTFFCLALGFLPILPYDPQGYGPFDWHSYGGQGAYQTSRLDGLEKQLVAETARWDRQRLRDIFGVQISSSGQVKGVRLALVGLKGLLMRERKSLGLLTDLEVENQAGSLDL